MAEHLNEYFMLVFTGKILMHYQYQKLVLGRESDYLEQLIVT